MRTIWATRKLAATLKRAISWCLEGAARRERAETKTTLSPPASVDRDGLHEKKKERERRCFVGWPIPDHVCLMRMIR